MFQPVQDESNSVSTSRKGMSTKLAGGGARVGLGTDWCVTPSLSSFSERMVIVGLSTNLRFSTDFY